jgi:hypothetical protein
MRNASRLDRWRKELAKLLGGTFMPSVATRPVGRATSHSLSLENQLPVQSAVEELVVRVRASPSASSGGKPALAERLAIVRLAAILTTRSPEAASMELKRVVPSADGSKAARLCRLIARPEVNLRTLARIAYLLPNFRAVVFIMVEPPGHARLSRQQIPTLAEAWDQLGLPKLDRLPRSVSRKKNRFQKDCSRAFPVHCDAQLLLRYEAEPSLKPTLPYVGCSKRACFLCHCLLSVLAFQTRFRGYHGVCHPLWGVGLAQSEGLRQQLPRLCRMIKEKIMARLSRKRNRPVTMGIPQSSAVSDLRSADMAVLRRRSTNREMLERRNQEFRQRAQIL